MMIEYSSLDKLVGAKLGPYHLEQLIRQGSWGPVFLARADGVEASFQVRLIVGSSNQVSHYHDAYLQQFQYQASQIAALQHPYILPLLDYGIYHGIPYLISPHIPMRSLRERLTKSGPMDVLTIGRYLDQIAATLEYAHQHTVLHGGLSVDCILIRLDGQVIVEDFGIWQLFAMNHEDVLRDQSNGRSETCAPEQLLGRTVGSYTDVYALGAVLYQLLTNAPVFPGSTPDETLQQHLYASVPPLSKWRSNLPAGLYSIIARALAKDPKQRFRQPGMLANAYHRLVDPNNRARMPFVIASTPVVHAQHPFAPVTPQPEVQLSELDWSNNGSTVLDSDSALQIPSPPIKSASSASSSSGQGDSPRPSLMRRFRRKNTQRTALIALLIILLVAASSLLGITSLLQKSAPTAQPTGLVTFLDNQNGPPGYTNALSIVIHGLDAPSSGFQYDAWLINDQTEGITALGALTARQQTFSMNYATESSNGQGGTNLLNAGDKLEVTLEQKAVQLPEGKVVLVGTLPPKAFAHIRHLLVGFPQTPEKIGFLVGVLQQTHLLNIQADVLQNNTASSNTHAVQCAAQSIIDVIEGIQGPHYRPLSQTCSLQNVTTTGDGFGLLGKGYIFDAAEHATFAIGQPDATNTMRLHEGLLEVALSNIKGWMTTVDQDALVLLKNPNDPSKVQEIVKLADTAYHGIDVNGDGQIDPVAGEAGALTAYLQGQLMASFTIVPNA